MTEHPTAELMAQRETTARMLWTGGIIGFFAIQAILWTVAITLTSQDPSHLVLEGYDQRALNWDSWQETLRASAALGWRSELEIGPAGSLDGRRDLLLRLLDRSGQPIDGAAVQLKLFHRARAAEAELLTLREALPGEYVGTFRPQHSGTWTFELSAERKGLEYLEVRKEEISTGRAKPARANSSEKVR